MTISVDGIDNHLSYEDRFHCRFAMWVTQDQASDAGKLSILIPNQSARFAERMIERLLLDRPFLGGISGVVTELGFEVSRVIRLYRRSDGQFVNTMLSDPITGEYAFTNLDSGEEFFAIAFDELSSDPNFNALVLDQIIA